MPPVIMLGISWGGEAVDRGNEPRVTLPWRLDSAGPRIVEPIAWEYPIVIFTDGACEDAGASIGGIIFAQGMRPQTFGAMLTKEATRKLASKIGQTQIIGQAELLPVLVAKYIWRSILANRRVIYFVDNDSARLALVRGYSPVITSLGIIMRCAHQDALSRSSSWYARVPSKSNIGDGPSRMDASQVRALYGAEVVQPALEDQAVWFTDTLRAEWGVTDP